MNDQAKRGNALSDTGKRSYTWQTMTTFSGTTGVVLLVWTGLKGLNADMFSGEITPFVLSFVAMIGFAVLTELPEEETTWRQKGQKAVITLANAFLVYSATLGLTGGA